MQQSVGVLVFRISQAHLLSAWQCGWADVDQLQKNQDPCTYVLEQRQVCNVTECMQVLDEHRLF